jgi:hypothetical protein
VGALEHTDDQPRANSRLMPRPKRTRIPGTAFGDRIGRPPEMRAIAIVAQNPAHGPAFDVAIDAVPPGIDFGTTTMLRPP